jgi:uncharacterized protein (TIGR03067 family)
MRKSAIWCVALVGVAGVMGRESVAAPPQGKTPAVQKGISLDLGGGVKLEMALIPAGEFLMGTAGDAVVQEKPQHRVRITRPFYLGKCLVTQQQWQAVMGDNPSRFKSPENPVEMTSWTDCQKFLDKLSAKFGPGQGKFQLPTEAQWEYACRAGGTTQYYFGDDEWQLHYYAWYIRNSGFRSHPVGAKAPNAWGLYDMTGNVWEWCQDWYSESYYANSPVDDPPGPATGAKRVGRGGSWLYPAAGCRSAFRTEFEPATRHNDLGFRVARAVTVETLEAIGPRSVAQGKPGSAAAAGAKAVAKDEKDDRQRIQGIWKAAGLESDGLPRPESAYSGTTITFQGDATILSERGYPPSTMSFKLDPLKSPKAIDLIRPSGPNKGEGLPGIYDLEGDNLKICFRIGKDRPKEFTTHANDDTEMFTLTRLPAELPWKRFTAEKDGYSVEFPGDPEARNREDRSLGIPVKATIYVVRSDRERLSYLAMGYTLPAMMKTESEMSQSLQVVRDRILQEFQGTVGRETKLEVKQGVGRQYEISSTIGAAAIVRVYLHGQRLVVLQAVGTNEGAKSKTIERFMNSLKIGDQP